MDDYGLDLHCEMLLDAYRQRMPLYKQLQDLVMRIIREQVNQTDISVASMESRIKEEKSFVGKLKRKGYKYAELEDITDILGVRVITFYNEEVDRIASLAESLFDIDWQNSEDKRLKHEFHSFGYNSLHYICRLREPVPPELREIRFELQIRTALQHVWSAIQHDIGYKTEMEIPIEHHRSLSRLAGLLELADNEFSRIRNAIAEYRHRINSLVQNGQYNEVPLDRESFGTYLSRRPYDSLNRKIAAITQAELHTASFLPFVTVLKRQGLKTLGDVEQMYKENLDDAYQLALFQLGTTDLDILSETIGLQNLCIVHLLKNGGGKTELIQMFEALNGPSPYNETLASIVMAQASRLKFMSV
jgi:ppGpp synthetase/RelA/SpoT-type nucleotidyltranferase